MVVLRFRSFLSGIRLTQVGDPLSHCQQGFGYGISSDRLAGLANLSVSESKDQEEANLVFSSGDVLKVRLDNMLLAELGPTAKDGALGLSGLSCGGLVCEHKRSVEISLEAALGVSRCSSQGSGCGWTWSKWARN